MTIDLALSNDIFISNDLDAAIQELDILMNTSNTELIGNVDYGTNFDQFLWELTPAEDSLRQYIIEKIRGTYFLSKMKTDVVVTIDQGVQRNIYNVMISVEPKSSIDSDSRILRKYQFR